MAFSNVVGYSLIRQLSDSVRQFLSGAWLSYIALLHWTQPLTYVASHIAAPLTYIVFFMYLGISASGRQSADFYLLGNVLHIAALNGIFGVTLAIGSERTIGTLVYLVGSPANRLSIYLGRAFFNVIDGGLGVALGFGWAILLGLDLSQANISGLALTLVIVTTSTCGLGLLMGSISLLTLNVMFLNNTIFFLLLLISGANLPWSEMPTWMQTLGSFAPLTRGIAAARLLADGSSLREAGGYLLVEIAIGLIYGLLGFVLLRLLETIAIRRGTLEAF